MKRVLVVCLIIVLGGWALKPVLLVEVYYPEQSQYLYQQPAAPGTVVTTTIKHSVELTPVVEKYEVLSSGGLLLTETIIMSQGFGMPSTFTNQLQLADGRLHITGFNRPLEYLPFRVSHLNEPQLLVNERELPLASLVADGKLIEITARKRPNASIWLERVVKHVI